MAREPSVNASVDHARNEPHRAARESVEPVPTLCRALGANGIAVGSRSLRHIEIVHPRRVLLLCQVPVAVFRFGFGSCVPVPEGVSGGVDS